MPKIPSQRTRLHAAVPFAAGLLIAALAGCGQNAHPSATSTKNPQASGSDINRVEQLRSEFTPDFALGETKRSTVTPETIKRQQQQIADITYSPAGCQSVDQDIDPDSTGTKFVTFTAEGQGLTYTVSGQELPPSSVGRKTSDPNCDYAQIVQPGVFTGLVTPVEPPKVVAESVYARRIVSTSSKPDKLVVDQYRYTAWTDARHAIIIVVSSNPFAVPPSNPVNPEFAQKLLSAGVKLVSGR
ncbi:DUF5642 family protein [Mycobacteroides abscessus]|uniref:DUF5642 family protein n=1 Tax=Mycobacteroides abscessus TaxID=36809 RepID=UPI00138FE00C|nr:DUF5642 family protein [Mycobacteroides abscessus]